MKTSKHPSGFQTTEPRMNSLISDLRAHLPAERVITDALRRLAYGTDASFYRLIPEAVAIVDSEDDVRHVLAATRAAGRPVTFRAAWPADHA